MYISMLTWYDGTTNDEGDIMSKAWDAQYAALNADTTIDPRVGNEYSTPAESTSLVLVKVSDINGRIIGKREIVLTGWGVEEYEKVGNLVTLRGDQSCRYMGTFLVKGIVRGGEVVGDVPNGKRRHYVMK